MTYLNLNIEDLRKCQFVGESPVNRGTWLCLLTYCATIENGGVIRDCRGWKSRMWEQSCCVTKEEVMADSDLWQWEGEDLLVWNYPSDVQATLEVKRSNGRFGSLGGRPKKNPPANPAQNPPGNPVSETGVTHPETRKETKGNETEGNETESARESTASPMTLAEAKTYAQTWTNSAPVMVNFDANEVELWFLDRQRKSWQASSGNIINTRAAAEADLQFWLKKNANNPAHPPRRDGRGNPDFQKKGGAGGGGNPLAAPPCADWKGIARDLAPHDSDLTWLQAANWTNLSSDDRQAIVSEWKRRNAGGAAA